VGARGVGWHDATLCVYDVRDVDGSVVWILGTNTVGRWLTVELDDATGEVLGHQVHGIR